MQVTVLEYNQYLLFKKYINLRNLNVHAVEHWVFRKPYYPHQQSDITNQIPSSHLQNLASLGHQAMTMGLLQALDNGAILIYFGIFYNCSLV